MLDNLNISGMELLVALPSCYNGLLDYCYVMKLMPWYFYINFGLRFTVQYPQFSSG